MSNTVRDRLLTLVASLVQYYWGCLIVSVFVQSFMTFFIFYGFVQYFRAFYSLWELCLVRFCWGFVQSVQYLSSILLFFFPIEIPTQSIPHISPRLPSSRAPRRRRRWPKAVRAPPPGPPGPLGGRPWCPQYELPIILGPHICVQTCNTESSCAHSILYVSNSSRCF